MDKLTKVRFRRHGDGFYPLSGGHRALVAVGFVATR